jgi:chloramphenicol 3-O phosphotransferase
VPSDGIDPAAADGFLLVYRGGPVSTFIAPDGRPWYLGATLVEVRIGPAGLRLLTGLYRAIAALVGAGNNVIVDEVIFDRRVLQAAAAALRDLPVLFVGVRCPLEVAVQREQARGDRGPGGAAAFNDLVHAHAVYDLEVDTSALSARECAPRIKETLDTGGAHDALRRLERTLTD